MPDAVMQKDAVAMQNDGAAMQIDAAVMQNGDDVVMQDFDAVVPSNIHTATTNTTTATPGDAPKGKAPAGDAPKAKLPAGDASKAKASAGDTPQGKAPARNVPNGKAPASDRDPSPFRKDDPRSATSAAGSRRMLRSGFVYDPRMRYHVENATADAASLHPEDPRRIHAIYEYFVAAGLIKRNTEGQLPAHDHFMARIALRPVTQAEACLVHTPEHWKWVQQLRHLSPGDKPPVQHPRHKLESVYVSCMTPIAAELSAGGAIEACRAVMLDKVKNAFALIRPPGHHAEREDVKGFCIFDNVSIATRACRVEFAEQCRKVLILDWDVHHGNGPQRAHYDDPNVLYISLHVHIDAEGAPFYPETTYRDGRVNYGDHTHCGEGRGIGKNVNIPWRQQGMGDADYIYAFQELVMPIATEFNPDLVIIAAGFDAADGDMLGGCHVTPAGYAHMTHMLMSLADGRVVACLEGGYNLDSIARCATAVAQTFMGEPPVRLTNLEPSPAGVEDVQLVVRQHSQYWGALFPRNFATAAPDLPNGQWLDQVIRTYQAAHLWDTCAMVPMFIRSRHPSSSAFQNQVLATPNWSEAQPLLVILHDAPEVAALVHPVTGQIEPRKTWLTDTVKTYVEWAVEHGFAVIDVNLPQDSAGDGDDEEQSDDGETNELLVERRKRDATWLLKYLWDNYIQVHNATHLFLIGNDVGHVALANLIQDDDGGRVREKITAAISFVDQVDVHPCASPSSIDVGLPAWYRDHSLVFVSPHHRFWQDTKQPKSRFGRVTKTLAASMPDMLREARDKVFDRMQEDTSKWRAERSRQKPTTTVTGDGSGDTTGVSLAPGNADSTGGASNNG